MKHFIYILLFLHAFPFLIKGQVTDIDSITRPEKGRICYTHIMMSRMDPVPPHQKENTNSHKQTVSSQAYYIIPTVVHVIHLGGQTNLSDQRIRDQIKVLNEDFGSYGFFTDYPEGADTKIRFCLAKTDPNGNPSTGVVRVFSEAADLNSYNEMRTKNLSLWDQSRYCNIWVVSAIDGDDEIQGYSYLPGQGAGPNFNGDGIVIVYKYFGTGPECSEDYQLGRTTTHEAGHYLDLKHTWGGDNFGQGGCNDDDGIDDTPICAYPYYSVPDNNGVCEHPLQCNNIRLIEDFMDYSLDICMGVFTPQQGLKMRAALEKYRSKLIAYDNVFDCGCQHVYDSLNNQLFDFSIYPNPVDQILKIRCLGNINGTLSLALFDLYGREIININESVQKSLIFEINTQNLRPGLYIIKASFLHQKITEKLIKL